MIGQQSSISWGVHLGWASLFLTLSVVAGASSALAQNANYDPQSGSETRFQAPHTGILNGKFWTDTRYRYEYVDPVSYTHLTLPTTPYV